MFDLPLFADAPSEIASHYQPDAQVVLYAGDAGDLIREIPTKSIALVITSPPYNIGKITSVESRNKTLHIEAWDDAIEPMDKMPLLPY